jgi:hypothetical protein
MHRFLETVVVVCLVLAIVIVVLKLFGVNV